MYSHRFLSLCSDTLATGVEELSLTDGVYLAIVSHIHDDQYEIVAVHSRAGVFKAGESYALEETLCKEVFISGATIAFTSENKPDRFKIHPLYSKMGIEVYISTPIRRGDEIWGTLNFSDMRPSRGPFTARDIAFVEKAAADLSSDALSMLATNQ